MSLPWDIMVKMHKGELTVREAFAMAASAPPSGPTPSHAEIPGDEAPGPDLCVYIPFSATGNLGDAYNRVMARLHPGEWAVFLDHDAMILTNDFWTDLRHAMAARPDAGAIVCWTNRTGNSKQKAKAPEGDDITAHTARAHAIRREYGQGLTDVSGDQMTGIMFAVSRDAWDAAGPFVKGFGEVDNNWARQCGRAGLKMWRMNGVYVYHQRRTNGWKGATRPEMGCRGVQWKYAAAAPIMAAHGNETIQILAAQHAKLVESRTDWTDCQKSARRKSLLSQWRTTMAVSLVIPAREEPAAELARTIKSFRDGGAKEIIVLDDGSEKCPVGDDCGADIIIRHERSMGVSASRNEGLARATGNVIAYSDSHCHIAEGCSFMDWAYEAFTSEDMLCAVCGSYEDPDKWFWGCGLPWKGWRYDVSANRTRTDKPAGVFGSVYAAARWTWDRIGGWVPTRGWGYNEQALSLACRHAGVTIRVEDWFRARHKFRNDRKFPYAVSGRDFQANAPWTHWLLSTDAEWAAIAEVMAAANRQAYDRAKHWRNEPASATIREAYQARMAAGRRDPAFSPINTEPAPAAGE